MHRSGILPLHEFCLLCLALSKPRPALLFLLFLEGLEGEVTSVFLDKQTLKGTENPCWEWGTEAAGQRLAPVHSWSSLFFGREFNPAVLSPLPASLRRGRNPVIKL